MTPNEIRHFVSLQKKSLSQVAKAIDEPQARVSETINGTRKNQRIRQKLADYFNLPVDVLFGPEFDAVAQVMRNAA